MYKPSHAASSPTPAAFTRSDRSPSDRPLSPSSSAGSWDKKPSCATASKLAWSTPPPGRWRLSLGTPAYAASSRWRSAPPTAPIRNARPIGPYSASRPASAASRSPRSPPSPGRSSSDVPSASCRTAPRAEMSWSGSASTSRPRARREEFLADADPVLDHCGNRWTFSIESTETKIISCGFSLIFVRSRHSLFFSRVSMKFDSLSFATD